jgi:hypothetical protein
VCMKYRMYITKVRCEGVSWRFVPLALCKYATVTGKLLQDKCSNFKIGLILNHWRV